MHLSTVYIASVIAASVVCGLPLQNVYPSTSSNVLGGGHPDSSLYPRGQLCCGFSRGNTPHNGGGETAHDHGGNTAHDRGGSPPHGSGGNTPHNCGSNTFHGSGGDTESRGSGDTDCGSRLNTANGANDRSAPVGSFTYISSDGSHSDSQDDAASSKESTYSSVTGAEYGSARSRQSAPSISSALNLPPHANPSDNPLESESPEQNSGGFPLTPKVTPPPPAHVTHNRP
ncbi:hypothetical protein F5878DRAFT_665526 [Lentinula raphanica]|uniref:Uncharacterized protein n=1 Tax=Lentinula raphanica TaxID=153919 RepID=A0AA38NZU7_9AGAR|nr:hypothetical protein F5878DRAFT_665526 [Lentinula raphanica]